MPNGHNVGFWANWAVLGSELRIRLLRPFQESTFVLYFFFVMIGVGSFGIWVPPLVSALSHRPISIDELSIPYAIATYAVAILAAALADVMVAFVSRPLRMFVFAISILAGSLALFSLVAVWPNTALRLATPAAVLSLVLWWVANGCESRFQDQAPQLPGGDEPQNESLAGTTEGFAT
jgi:uncharacterized membrane protein YfcA